MLSFEHQKNRNLLKQAIREFFLSKEYIEVETPTVVLSPGVEVHLDYFYTYWNDYKKVKKDLWLRSSPEQHMKQLLSDPNYKRIFQLANCFRNGGELAQWHHPEFTMLEWYEKDIQFLDFIDQTENLIRFCNDFFLEKSCLNLPSKFVRWKITEAIYEFTKIELIDLDPDLAKKAKSRGVVSVNDTDDFETAFFKILLEKIEPQLQRHSGAILYDYPPSQAALAIVEHGVAKRFEVYINGIELSNGYYELLDAQENVKRINESNKQRKMLNKCSIEVDDDFIIALQNQISPSCGNALGFDRLLALILGHVNIDSITPFRESVAYGVRPDF